MIRELFTAVASWYRRDRIRVSPTEGRLHRLNVGERILLRDRIFDIANRRCEENGAQFTIDYHLIPLSNPNRQAKLMVLLVGDDRRFIAGRLIESDQSSDVFEDDLVVVR